MSFEITNRRSGESFVANGDETILAAALRAGRLFPYGCRNGVCGACKSTLVSGRVEYGEYDKAALDDDERAQGKALLCQAIALEDVVVDVAEIATDGAIQIKMLPCRIAKMEKLADDVMRVFLQLPRTQTFNFLPGQYIDLIMKDGARRSFSIANLPDESREEGIELHIRRVPGGRFTPKLFDVLRERDLLRLEGPFGGYVWQSADDAPVLMIAGGTGFSPVKGLIGLALQNNPRQRMHLFWGARDEQDLYLHELAQTWADAHENFDYTPVLSSLPPARAAQWQGARGWVHDAVLEAHSKFDEFDVYASGPPVMIDALRSRLGEKGMRESRFFFDSFTYADDGGDAGADDSNSASDSDT